MTRDAQALEVGVDIVGVVAIDVVNAQRRRHDALGEALAAQRLASELLGPELAPGLTQILRVGRA
jgi:hypothetical protein